MVDTLLPKYDQTSQNNQKNSNIKNFLSVWTSCQDVKMIKVDAKNYKFQKTFPISQKVVTFKSYYLPRDTRLFTTHSNIYVYYTISHA